MLSKLDALSQVPMFREAPARLVEEILEACAERVYMRGETVFLQGDPPRGLFVVWRGAVKIFKIGEEGREQILEIEGPGRSVAELPLFDGLPYPASCAALEDTVVLHLSVEAVHRILDKEPIIARAAISTLSQRLRRMVALVEEISLKAVRVRLAGLLLEFSDGRDEFELPWTNQEIASRIGTVREIVSRAMSRMAHEGAIRLEGRKLTILDRRRL